MMAMQAIAKAFVSAKGGVHRYRLCQAVARFSSVAHRDDNLVYAEHAPVGYDGSAAVYQNVITKEEELKILEDLKTIFRRRRYERGHWDAVIIKYKETELFNEPEQLSETSRGVLQRIREHLKTQGHVPPDIRWLPSHAIELHPEGELRAHIDSVRFSGGLVAGLSLGTSSIMRLKLPEDEEETDKKRMKDEGYVDLLLPSRSLYALTGKSRYDYTHELLQNKSRFGGTGETVERSEHRWSIIFRDDKGDEQR